MPGLIFRFRRWLFCAAVVITLASITPVYLCGQQSANAEKIPDAATDAATEASSETATSATAATKSAQPFKNFFNGSVPQTIEELRSMEVKFAEVADLVKPATVNIQMGGAQGSGVVVTSSGYILTAAHVIGRPGGKASVVFPDGKKFKATTLGIDTNIDSGMLKIDEGQDDDYPYLAMGLSDRLEAGQWVMAIGHPGGMDEDRGLVVRVGRILAETNRVIRTDCTLVGGDSGGPLVDMNGDVVGIHSRIGSQLWNNLHVPVDTYAENWDRLAEGIVLDGKPNFGFSVVESTNKIESLTAKGPADKAGMKVGDVIKKMGDFEIFDRDDIQAAAKELLPNMKIEIIVERNGEEKILNLKIGQW